MASKPGHVSVRYISKVIRISNDTTFFLVFSIRYNVRYITIRIKYYICFGYFHTLTTHYEVFNQSYIILCKCQYLEMLHSIAMVAWYSTGNAYKKGKSLKRYKKKTTGPFSKILWGVNRNSPICLF